MPSLGRLVASPARLAVVWLLVGIGAVLAAVYLGRPFSVGEVLYDIGFSLGVATAVSFVLALYLRRIERLEQAQRDAEARFDQAQREAELNRREADRELRARFERRFDALGSEVEGLVQDVDRGLLSIKFDWVESRFDEVNNGVERLQDELRDFRFAVDKNYDHPDAAVVDRLKEALQREGNAEPLGHPGSEAGKT